MDLIPVILVLLAGGVLVWILMSMKKVGKCVVGGQVFFTDNIVVSEYPSSKNLVYLEFDILLHSGERVHFRTIVPSRRNRFRLNFLGGYTSDPNAWSVIEDRFKFEYLNLSTGAE